jgi:hypothetical protein
VLWRRAAPGSCGFQLNHNVSLFTSTDLQLWENQGNSGDFNGDELELTYKDLEILELDVIAGTLPNTSGFFFGNNADEHYRESDLEFVKNARAELFLGLKVFYNSSW